MIRTTVYFTDELIQALQRKARRTGASQAELIREAVAESLKGDSVELPRSFGMAESGRIGACNLDAWLDEHWKRD
ncbi:hypothetical protein BH23CHL4_BH23CHL4_29270 [soil metagenome]